MSWRINKIIFQNFKVFKDSFSFDLEGKNFLLFGENGSGKSSLNWGLYTFLQSVLKLPNLEEAQKYFNPDHDQNLRNRFSNRADISGIKIEFKNEIDNSLHILEDSIQIVNTHSIHGLNIKYSLGASDFLNYKYLLSVFDFKNSDKNDIFPLFYQDIFPIDDFPLEVKNIDGIAIGKNMKIWWQTLQETLTQLPRGRGRSRNHILRRGVKWEEFNNQLIQFNNQLDQFLESVEIRANHILSYNFNTQAEINFEYQKAELHKVSTSESGDLKLFSPRIIAKAKYLHPTATNQEVTHPRSFFNEATLSKMALALRLAITHNRIANGADVCKILVIDDLLISLDMANRCKVIDTLLNFSSTFQLIIMTHDRSFYQVISNKIQERKEISKWKLAQIYIKPSLNSVDIPTPVLVENKPGLEQAKDFFLRGEFEAAIVTLRKECEVNLKKLIPFIDIINVDKAYSKGEIKYVDLSKMMDKLPLYYAKHFDPGMSTSMPNLTPNLHTYRELLLNQAAHNDYETPRFTGEIQAAFQEIELLTNIKKYILIRNNQINIDEYQFSINDAGGNAQSFLFKFGDIFSLLSYGANDYYINSLIIDSTTGCQIDMKRKITDFCAEKMVAVPSDILQNITHVNDGILLHDILCNMKS